MDSKNFNKWRAERLREVDGVLIGSDEQLEWLLPWWWENYSRCNSFPVAFADFGMTEAMRAWCQQRGEVIDLTFPDMCGTSNALLSLFAMEHQMEPLDDALCNSRNAWFKKPLACLQTPFKRTIWMDLDCEVRKNVGELFAIGEHSLALTQDAYIAYATSYPIYNSGVFAFPKELPVIQEWAQLALEQNHLFLGDQDLLSWIIDQKKLDPSMPKVFNWSRLWESNPEAFILHWHGSEGKEQIRNMIAGAR